MQRRSFIKQSVLWTAGCAVGSRMSLWGTVSAADEVKGTVLRSGELYKLFRDPTLGRRCDQYELVRDVYGAAAGHGRRAGEPASGD